jgi:hypothetical protein
MQWSGGLHPKMDSFLPPTEPAPQQHQQQQSSLTLSLVGFLFSGNTAISSSCHRGFTLNLDPQQKQKSSEFE